MSPLVISLIVFIAVAAGVAFVFFLFRDLGSTTAEDRLSALTGKGGGDRNQASQAELLREGVDGVSGLLGGIIQKFGNFSLLFEQANTSLKPETFMMITVACGAIGVVGSLIAHAPPPLYPVAAMMGAILPLFFLLFKRRRRFNKFAQQLPDAMELVARALRSGHSLASGLYVVVEEMPDPISMEFNFAYEEQNLGIPLEQALKNMLNRMPNLDLRFFVTAVAIQRQAGGDMAEILDKIGYIIRERFKIIGQVKALTGEGRISGIVLMALPIGLFLTVYYLNPDYVMLLFTEEIGRKMIAAAIFLQVLGAVAIKKIVNIKI